MTVVTTGRITKGDELRISYTNDLYQPVAARCRAFGFFQVCVQMPQTAVNCGLQPHQGVIHLGVWVVESLCAGVRACVPKAL